MRVPRPRRSPRCSLVAVAGARCATCARSARRRPLGGASWTQRFAGGFDLVGVHWLGRGSGRVPDAQPRAAAGAPGTRARPRPEDVPRGAGARLEARQPVRGPAPSNGAPGAHSRARRPACARSWCAAVESGAAADGSRRRASPAIIPRLAWARGQAIAARAAALRADAVRFAVVHHTAGATPATPAQSAAMVRAIERLPRAGERLERHRLQLPRRPLRPGLRGPLRRDRPDRRSARTRRGSTPARSASRCSAPTRRASPTPPRRPRSRRLLAWRLDLAHVDPLSTVSYASGGNREFRAGRGRHAARGLGPPRHGLHDLPRHALYALLPQIARARRGDRRCRSSTRRTCSGAARRARALHRPRLGRAAVDGDRRGRRRHASSARARGRARPWTGRGTRRGRRPARYHWTIPSGTARPARRVVHRRRRPRCSRSRASASPAVVSPRRRRPRGRGHGQLQARRARRGDRDAARPARARCWRRSPQGEQTAGAHTLTWPAEAYPDGPYSIVLSAQAAGRQVTATVPVSVNRTLSGPRPVGARASRPATAR